MAETEDDGPLAVKIIQPSKDEQIQSVLVDIKVEKKIRVIANVELDFEEEYESPYIDVREYRNAAFYVQPVPGLSSPFPKYLYQLDAFFSLTGLKKTVWNMGDKKPTLVLKGWQEFGSMQVTSKEELIDDPSFTRLSTGETTSRVLYTRIYAPFVRVVLKNHTPGDKKSKFKITAYLTR